MHMKMHRAGPLFTLSLMQLLTLSISPHLDTCILGGKVFIVVKLLMIQNIICHATFLVSIELHLFEELF